MLSLPTSNQVHDLPPASHTPAEYEVPVVLKEPAGVEYEIPVPIVSHEPVTTKNMAYTALLVLKSTIDWRKG